MEALRNLVVWLLVAAGMAGFREMKWPVEPESGEIVIRTITTDVQRGGAFSIEGQNLGRLAGSGWVVFYGHQNIRLPMQLVIGNTLFGCVLPDSVRSGRVQIVDRDGVVVMDTLLNVYGDFMGLNACLLQSTLWNQRLWIRDGIEPILIDQNSRRYSWIRHPSEKYAWIAPRCVGFYRFVKYDSRSGLYYHLSPGMRLERPVLEQGQPDDRTALITRYAWADGERIRLRSQDHVYEREMEWRNHRIGISLIDMQPGRYTAEIVTDTTADAIGGEIVIPMPGQEGRDVIRSWIRIRGSYTMGLNITTDYISRNGERDRDSVTKDTIMDIHCEFNGCTIERISLDTFLLDGVGQAGEWSIKGVLVKNGQTFTTNLILQDGAGGGIRTQVHALRLRQWPSAQGPRGFSRLGCLIA